MGAGRAPVGVVQASGSRGTRGRTSAAGVGGWVVEVCSQTIRAAHLEDELQSLRRREVSVLQIVEGLDVDCRGGDVLPGDLDLTLHIAIETGDVEGGHVVELAVKPDFVLRGAHGLDVEGRGKADVVLATQLLGQLRPSGAHVAHGRPLVEAAVVVAGIKVKK